MDNKKPNIKVLPKNTKFATFDSDNKDIILGEYLIATLIYNGESLDKILKSANEIKNKKEREDVKTIMYNIILDFIKLNPEYVYLINDDSNSNKTLESHKKIY